MKVLIATHETQGTHDDDVATALDGELVHLPLLACTGLPDCACRRTFEGVTSRGSTTTVAVAERPLQRDVLTEVVADALLADGWALPADAAPELAPRLAGTLILGLLDLAARLPLGTVLGRRGETLLVRALEPADRTTGDPL